MGLKKDQIGSVAAASAAVQAGLDGVGGFWSNPVGKAVLEFAVVPAADTLSADTGIIVAPTAAEWSMFPWRWEAVESVVGSQLSARLYTGFIVFSDIVGNPLVRFGTGAADPGFSSNGGLTPASGFATGLTTNDVHPRTAAPITVLASGEIVLWMFNDNGSVPGFVKGTFTVGPEIILADGPTAPPPVP